MDDTMRYPTQWEYFSHLSEAGFPASTEFAEVLNERGEDGWELCAVVPCLVNPNLPHLPEVRVWYKRGKD